MLKRIVSIGLVIMVVLSLIVVGVVTGRAETFVDGNGISWGLVESYPGWAIYPIDRDSISGNIVLPETYNNKVITSISEYAFSNCDGLTSITIPDSVTSIGQHAFECCTNLESIDLSNSLQSIGLYAFRECSKLTSIEFPDTLKSIGDYLFQDCSSLSKIDFGDGLKKIERRNLGDNLALEEVIIGNGMIEIGSQTFSNCSGLTRVRLGNNVQKIGISAFAYCKNIESLEIPNSVVEIGGGAFRYLTSLSGTLIIPQSVTKIGSSAFWGCENLEGVEFNEGLKTIDDYAFYNCSRLSSVSIPNSVEEIGIKAFPESLGIASTKESESVQTDEISFTDDNGVSWCGYGYLDGYSIYPNREDGSSSLSGRVVVPDTYNGKPILSVSGFEYCSDLTSVVIPDSVISIGQFAFQDCTNLNSVNIPNSVVKIGRWAFANCDSLTGLLVIPDSVVEIGERAFYPTNYTGLILGNNVKTIGEHAFSYPLAGNLIIPDSVTDIGGWAFATCRFDSITIGNNVTHIGDGAFENCSNISQIIIPESVVEIGDRAFNHCNGLANSTITIPQSVTWVGELAFADIGYIPEVVLNNHSLSQIDSLAFCYDTIGNFVLGENLTNIDTPLLSGGAVEGDIKLGGDVRITNKYAFYGNDNMSITTPVTNTNVIEYARRNSITLNVLDPITESGGSKEAIVVLDYDPANLKVTVPTVLPVNVDSNNNVTVADNAQISNLSNGQVDITNAEIQTDKWSVVDFNTDFTKVPVDTKQYGFELNGDNVSDGINTSVFSTINGNDHICLLYDANVAIQSNAISDEEIGRIVFTVAWHK